MAEKIYDLRDRTFVFAQNVLNMTERLPRNPESEVIRKQLAKAGTSIGANVEEADGTLTKKDFKNKMVIARKEAKETRYWLRIISGKYIKTEEIGPYISEVQELVNILSAIINKIH